MLETGRSSEVYEYHFLGYRLDIRKRCLYDPQGEVIALSSRAIDTLQLLVMHMGQILSKSFLVEKVWPDTYVDENNLNQAITSLRRALGDSKHDSRFIKTVTGRGYCFIAELDSPEAADSANVETGPLLETSAEAFTDLRVQNQAEIPQHSRHLLLQGNRAIGLIAILCALGAVVFLNTDGPALRASANPVASAPVLPPSIQKNPNPEIIPNSIAILPLNNLNATSDANNHIFALGLHAELINQLSMINKLNLVSRESVLSPKIQQSSIPEIGRLLRVESVITGTVLFVENQARINLQMINPETGMIKWTFAYDVNTSSFKDLIYAQSDIASRVSEELRTDLAREDLQEKIDWPTESYEAYRYNIAATHASYEGAYAKTWALSKKALALDPEYLDALYNYSKANTILASAPLKNMTTHEHLQLALESAQRIVDLAPNNHKGHVIKAVVLGNQAQWEAAALEMETLDETGAPLWDMQLLVKVLLSSGDFRGAIELLEANLKVEPVDRYGRGFLMAAYEMAGNRMQARREYDTGEELSPLWWGDTVNVFLALGRNEQITDIDELSKARAPENIKQMLYLINQGQYSELPEKLKLGLGQGSTPYGKIIYYAAIAAYIGENAMAIEFMKQATDELATNFLWFWLPVFHDIRQLPEFKRMLEDAGLVAFWRTHGWPDICQPIDDSFVCN